MVSGGLGLYHLTHRGAGSGVTEIAFAGLLLLSIYLISHSRRRMAAGMVVIGGMASVLLPLSVYHLTHQGPGSFVIELGLTGTLVSVICLVSPPKP